MAVSDQSCELIAAMSSGETKSIAARGAARAYVCVVLTAEYDRRRGAHDAEERAVDGMFSINSHDGGACVCGCFCEESSSAARVRTREYLQVRVAN